ncbi:DUF397 domain-containing protein [Streptomyces sp. ZYX-F-203]
MAISQGAADHWIKSSYSGGNGACVEVRSPAVAALLVRDSKMPEGPTLAFPSDAWTSFLSTVKG